MSPSALSQMVRGLEERVGVRLLNRTTRSVALTEAGANLFHRVRPAVSELGEAIGQLRVYRERPAGAVRIRTFRSAAANYLEPMLASFARSYPDVVLDITIDDEVVDIVAGGYDVAIRIGEVIERDMIAVRLGPDLRQLAVASSDYLASSRISKASARSRQPSLHPLALAGACNALRVGVLRGRAMVLGGGEWSADRRRQGDHAPRGAQWRRHRFWGGAGRCLTTSRPAGWCRCWSNGPRRFRDYSFAIRNSGKCRPRCGPSSMR